MNMMFGDSNLLANEVIKIDPIARPNGDFFEPLDNDSKGIVIQNFGQDVRLFEF